MRTLPVLSVDLPDQRQSESVRRSFSEIFRGHVEVQSGVTAVEGQPHVVLLPVERVSERPVPGAQMVAVGDLEPAALVELLAPRPWLNHVAPYDALAGGVWGTSMAGAIWHLLGRRYSTSPFFGADFKGRQLRIRDSSKSERAIARIHRFAAANGASPGVCERIHDIIEELIANALYDAPTERHGSRADRTAQSVLEHRDACVVTYGVAHQTFFLRVRDPFGSLLRKRLLTVLERCATQSAIPFDTSRGGAGLGMWRVFCAASLFLVYSRHDELTEFVIGIDLVRARSRRGHAVHLFFEDDTTGLPHDLGPS